MLLLLLYLFLIFIAVAVLFFVAVAVAVAVVLSGAVAVAVGVGVGVAVALSGAAAGTTRHPQCPAREATTSSLAAAPWTSGQVCVGGGLVWGWRQAATCHQWEEEERAGCGAGSWWQ